MSLAVVPISESHAAGFRACLDAVARERRYLAMTEAPPLEKVLAFVRESVACDAAQFVALDGEQVVGWADILRPWPQAVAHCGRLGMGVLASHRGRGLGRRLLQACLDKAERQGAVRIELEARADNARALGLYASMGFEHEALKRRALCFDGVYFDAVQMSRIRPGT